VVPLTFTDKSSHEASANRKITFEPEDSCGNKVFKKATQTDQFGVASAEFGLADEVNLGTYHVRALMGNPDAPTNRAEIALNMERYVLPKFKVGVEFTEKGKRRSMVTSPVIMSRHGTRQLFLWKAGRECRN
jgi:uncharacterized protein YfaS (alpha-2-macroglobulin family)